MKKIQIILFVFILLLSFLLRSYKYDIYPRHGATFDEFAWTWLGINLIQKHTPISWSSQPQYKNRYHLIYQGAAFWIVNPYLEHPPFFGLVAGGFSLLAGVQDMNHVTLHKIRHLSVILGVLSVLMVFIFTRGLYGTNLALLASLIYGTVPTIVIGSRIVENENFLIPMWLFSLFLMKKYLDSNKRWLRNFSAIIAGILSISKVPWLVAWLSLSMILGYKKKWRDVFTISLIIFAIFSTYIIYGFYFDKEVFINLWKLQVARYDISFAGLYSIFLKPLLVDRFYLDGWIFFGWFSIVLLSRDFKKNYMILIPFISYFIIYIFAIPDEPSHGWYRYPFYPFLLISLSVFLKEEFRKISLNSLLFILFVGLSMLNNFWQQTFGFSYSIYRAFILISSASILIPIWFGISPKKYKLILGFWIMLLLILNIFSIVNYIE